ncbi:MAG: protein-methionine-sulfoxide reductase heme-binding subunit MsrQ [Paracoccaceae bacterium]
MTLVTTLNSAARRVPAWLLYIGALLPVGWLAYATLTGGLGIDPVKTIEHQLGIWALQVFIASLAITPLRTYTGLNLIRFRRALGLITFFYVALHLATWLLLDLQLLWGEIWKDILKRPYITIGMVSFVLILPLAITSNNRSVRRLGAAAWQRLHKLAYPAILLGAIHFVMVQKVWETEALVYLGLVILLLATRIRQILPKTRNQPA